MSFWAVRKTVSHDWQIILYITRSDLRLVSINWQYMPNFDSWRVSAKNLVEHGMDRRTQDGNSTSTNDAFSFGLRF